MQHFANPRTTVPSQWSMQNTDSNKAANLHLNSLQSKARRTDSFRNAMGNTLTLPSPIPEKARGFEGMLNANNNNSTESELDRSEADLGPLSPVYSQSADCLFSMKAASLDFAGSQDNVDENKHENPFSTDYMNTNDEYEKLMYRYSGPYDNVSSYVYLLNNGSLQKEAQQEKGEGTGHIKRDTEHLYEDIDAISKAAECHIVPVYSKSAEFQAITGTHKVQCSMVQETDITFHSNENKLTGLHQTDGKLFRRSLSARWDSEPVSLNVRGQQPVKAQSSIDLTAQTSTDILEEMEQFLESVPPAPISPYSRFPVYICASTQDLQENLDESVVNPVRHNSPPRISMIASIRHALDNISNKFAVLGAGRSYQTGEEGDETLVSTEVYSLAKSYSDQKKRGGHSKGLRSLSRQFSLLKDELKPHADSVAERLAYPVEIQPQPLHRQRPPRPKVDRSTLSRPDSSSVSAASTATESEAFHTPSLTSLLEGEDWQSLGVQGDGEMNLHLSDPDFSPVFSPASPVTQNKLPSRNFRDQASNKMEEEPVNCTGVDDQDHTCAVIFSRTAEISSSNSACSLQIPSRDELSSIQPEQGLILEVDSLRGRSIRETVQRIEMLGSRSNVMYRPVSPRMQEKRQSQMISDLLKSLQEKAIGSKRHESYSSDFEATSPVRHSGVVRETLKLLQERTRAYSETDNVLFPKRPSLAITEKLRELQVNESKTLQREYSDSSEGDFCFNPTVSEPLYKRLRSLEDSSQYRPDISRSKSMSCLDSQWHYKPVYERLLELQGKSQSKKTRDSWELEEDFLDGLLVEQEGRKVKEMMLRFQGPGGSSDC